MSDLFVIMGDEHVKKSSTIRALTGISREGSFLISTNYSQPTQTLIFISSLQEKLDVLLKKGNSINTLKYTHSNFPHRPDVQSALAKGSQLLIPLWINGKGSNSIVSGDQYIHELVKSGWNLKGVVFLDNTNIPKNLLNFPSNFPHCTFTSIPKTHANTPNSKPANEIASYIRSDWGWK